MMILQFSLLHFTIMLLAPPSSSGSIAKPGCPDRCGSLPIPYPFGVGSGCSMEQSFSVTCNASTDPPKATLSITGSEIIEINPTNIRVKYPNLALSNYSRNSVRVLSVVYDLSRTQYAFSDDNWLTAIGCDDMAAVTGQANRSFSGGCVSYCQDRNDSGGVASCPDNSNGYGLGTGCCRTPIPKGTTNLYVNLTDVHKNWRESKLFSTSYAFVGEKKVITNQSQFSYRLNDLGERNLASLFLASMEANHLDTILDAQVSDQDGKEEVIAVTRLAERCLNPKGKMRPTMKEVAIELESILITQTEDRVEQTRVYETNPMMISDIEYTWTSGKSEISSSPDTHPFINSEIV